MADDPLDKIAGRLAKVGKPPRATPAGLPLVAPVEREPTLVQGFPGAPEPSPVSTTLESPPGLPRGPRIVTPPSFASPAAREAIKRDADRHGDVFREAPDSAPSLPPEPFRVPSKLAPERDWWRTAKGMAIVLPILVTSITGVLGGLTAAVVVPIVKAVREPMEGAKAKDVAEAKAAGERCDAAVASERRATLAREKALEDKLLAHDGRLDELSRRVPEVKPDPSRPPAARP